MVSTRDGPTDPPPTTPYDVVLETGLLRLRHYRPETPRAGSSPVLLIHSLLKRPYILDLVPERSVVRSILRQGSSVYLTDWLPPSDRDAGRGLQEYVESDLASAVDHMLRIERVDGVALVGCCLGGFLAAVYAALHPQAAKALAVFALPFQSRPPFVPAVAEYLARLYGNVPASWLRAALNVRVANPAAVPGFLAAELGEPELASPSATAEILALQRAFSAWLASDVPFAGRLFSDVMGDAYGRGLFAANRLTVGSRRVALEDIRCRTLSVCAKGDTLVPVAESIGFVQHAGTGQGSNLLVAGGHVGLLLSRAAHDDLWPRVTGWLGGEPSAAGVPEAACA